jgi:uncharacterized protein YkwD
MSPRRLTLSLLARLAGASALAVMLAACGETGGALAPGLVASMDAPGAQLDRGAAFNLLNQYRSTVGVGALTDDPALDTIAQNLAQTYATTGTAPQLPTAAIAVRASAGYTDFAETFSGWRNSPPDAAVLGTASATRAGLAEFYAPNSAYGVYWILVLGS